MLPKKQRPTTASVHYLLRRGKRRHGRRLTIYRIDGQRSCRRGVHVAKKIARHATQRNAAKRSIFSLIKSAGGQDIDDGLFFVTVNKKYADEWGQLFATKGDISIYNTIQGSVQNDIISFIAFYLSHHR